MDELKKAYLLLQDNCGIKVGDTVRVLRKAETDECGWDNAWTQNPRYMDAYIGEKSTVESVGENGIGLLCDKADGGEWEFPFFVLEKIAHEVAVPADTAISLRDQFAMAALTGVIGHPQGMTGAWSSAAHDAYKAADAMLKARDE